MTTRIALALALVLSALAAVPSAAETPAPLGPRPGWVVQASPHAFAALVQRLEAAVAANGMVVVNAASASDGARGQGFQIPGNRVVGVFRNDYARRMLAASLPAGIEAPIRFYVTEGANGVATLSWRQPSAVFAPYFDDAGPDLRAVAAELDPVFAKIAADATAP